MAEQHNDQVRVPRGILIAAFTLITVTTAAVALFRIAGMEPVAQVPAPEDTVETRDLRFEDQPDGVIAVYELEDGDSERIIHVIEPGTGNFIRGVLRSLARARRAANVGTEYPFQLSLQADGKIFLEDPATGQRIYVQAFGPANVESFKTLLTSEGIQ